MPAREGRIPKCLCARAGDGYNGFAEMTMKIWRVRVAVAVCLLACAKVWAQTDESTVKKELSDLTFYGIPAGLLPATDAVPKAIEDADRPAAIKQAAQDIAALPAGPRKVTLAYQLAVISTQGQNGISAMQAAADTLAAALKESPQPAGKNGQPAQAYMELARIAHFANVQTTLSDPQMDLAAKMVLGNEAAAQKADFTLRDLDNKKVTLSALKGKIVLLNFSSVNCGACLREMGDLELIHELYASAGVVVLSIAEDDPAQVFRAMSRLHYLPQVLVDDSSIGSYGAAAQIFHIDGVPRTFAFDRDGKLVAQSLDMCSRRQFLAMLGRAGLAQGQ